MEIAVSLLAAIIFAFALRNPLQKAPWVFYTLATCIDIAIIAHLLRLIHIPTNNLVFYVLIHGQFAFALFSVVMFIGVFGTQTRIRRWLQPIRGELSIFAALISVSHIAFFFWPYVIQATQLFSGSNFNVAIAFALSTLVVVLLIPLTVTSVKAIRTRMSTKTWKRLQSFAYVFYTLVALHAAIMLLPAALSGNIRPAANVAGYAVIALAYAALRIARSKALRTTGQAATNVTEKDIPRGKHAKYA